MNWSRPGRIWVPEAPQLMLRRHRETSLLVPKPTFGSIFHWELVRRDGSVKHRGSVHNLILDEGLAALHDNDDSHLGNNFYWRTCYLIVGTDNTEPAVGQSGVITPLASTNSAGGFSRSAGHSAGGGYVWGQEVRVFSFGSANGNLTELGTASGAHTDGARVNWNRQLFRDELGDPVTITKTSDEELRVTIETRLYWPATVVDSLMMATPGGDVETDYEIRPENVDSQWLFEDVGPGPGSSGGGFAGSLGDWTKHHRGVSFVGSFSFGATVQDINSIGGGTLSKTPSTIHGADYVEQTYTLTAAQGNFGGIEGIDSSAGADGTGYGVKFAPEIAKTSIDRLVVVVRQSIGRHTP